MSDDEGSDNGEPQYGVVFEDEEPSKKPDKYLRRDGKAAAKFPNGDSYVGEYRNGKRHGAGIYTFANGTRFEGEYADGVKEGQGKMLYPDGSVYSGSWLGDKRSGQGSYVYAAGAAKGDSYVGAWLNDRKHGKGTYTYASGSSITGEWMNGQVMHAKWNMADGSGFNGAWHKNQPSGFGLHTFVNGNQATGVYSIDRKEGYKWNSVAPVLSRGEAAVVGADGSAGAAVDPMKVAQRFIDKCVLKADHFEGIWRVKKEVEGCPNLRKVTGDNMPLFALGQPTRTGIKALVEWAAENHATEKIVWVSLRSEPIVYVNDNSFIPRSKHALNSPMSLRGLAATAAAAAASSSAATSDPQLTPVQLADVESRLVSKLSLDVSHHGNLHRYLKDTYAEVASDRRSIELSEEVPVGVDEDTAKESFGNAIATPAKIFEDLLEESGAEVEYHRIPLGGNGAGAAFPTPEQIDEIVAIVKAAEPSTGIVFNDQMGRGRATLASIIATLMKRATEALAASADRAEAEPEEPEEEEPEEPEQEPEADEDNPDADPDAERAPRPARAPRAPRAAPLGRTDLAGLDIPLFDPSQPNLKMGQYKMIMRLVREGLVVGGAAAGDQLKAEVDDAIDRCKAMQNLREIIQFSKDMYEKEEAAASEPSAPPAASDASGARRAFWIANAHNNVERYAFLMLFHAYVKANVESEYENQTFAQFCKAKKDVIREYIGSRQEGPLKEFNWQ